MPKLLLVEGVPTTRDGRMDVSLTIEDRANNILGPVVVSRELLCSILEGLDFRKSSKAWIAESSTPQPGGDDVSHH